MERIVRYVRADRPHSPRCSCFGGSGFTVRVTDEKVSAFGRIVSKDDDNVYIDWHELYGEGQEPKNWHGDPWPLSLFTEVIAGK